MGPGNRWMGFGFSGVNATDVTMPGSDAVVGEAQQRAGMVLLEHHIRVGSRVT